jgi:hypothetical protein
VQLGEELDAILAREQMIHYTAEIIATKAKGKNVRTKLINQKSCKNVVEKMVEKMLNSCYKVVKKLAKSY